MIYQFNCKTCDMDHDLYFTSIREYHVPPCPICGGETTRVYTAPALRCNGIRKTPAGMVEMGNDYPSITQEDRYANVEKEMHEYISQNSDLELSKL